MISLSKRLSQIADLVPSCEVLADVGTDHGYLPVFLLQQGKVKHVLASDIHEGPLRKASETASLKDLSDRMETILADGLQYPGADRAQTITICGMGGETIISILAAAPWTADHRRLILQPQSKLPELEHWLFSNGYVIEDAKLCLDSDKLYLTLSVFGGGTRSETTEQLLLRRRDPLFPVYVQRALHKARKVIEGLDRASTSRADERGAILSRVQQLEKFEKEMESW